MSRECLAGRPYPQNTRETQLSPSGLTLRIPVICKAYASFRGMLSSELLAKPLQASVAWVFTLFLSNTQPLQWNLIVNTEYKRLNNITIKFGTEYKPTKHNVVNNNFTVGIRVFIVGCMRNAKSQLQLKRAFWWLDLAIGTSRKFESWANCLARLEVFSYSATVGVILQLPLHASHVCQSRDLATCKIQSWDPVARLFLSAHFLSFLHTLSHTILT